MKKILTSLFCLFLFSSLFSEGDFPAKMQSSKVKIEISPYIYGEVFQPGYGTSIRTKVSGHTFELAPMHFPPSGRYFGSRTKKIGLTGAYFFTFRKDKIFRPYLGGAYTHIRDLHRTVSREYYEGELYKISKDPIEKKNLVSSIIGVQICFPNNDISTKVSGLFFIDILGPVINDEYGFRSDQLFFPRIGTGFQF